MEENSSAYQVQLPIFEGPLDLLLHLIKINEIDIYDIPIAVITAQYLEYLKFMRELNLDVAGEYLVMAATLAYIKSKMLLPSSPETAEEETGEDPRDELVQRLLDYQRFKQAAEKLGNKEILGRDVFARSGSEKKEENGEVEANLFDLIEALRGILKKVGTQDELLDFTKEKISLKDKMIEIIERLKAVESNIHSFVRINPEPEDSSASIPGFWHHQDLSERKYLSKGGMLHHSSGRFQLKLHQLRMRGGAFLLSHNH